nr:hypothetical protein [uncultured Fluviicola sp.]
MKTILYSVLFLLTITNSFTQTSVSDTAIHVRGQADFYIDGIKVRGSRLLPKTATEEVSVITGGLPVNYGDSYCGCIIRINCPPKTAVPTVGPKIMVSDKEQKMATE